MARKIKAQYMIIDLICVLIKAAKGIDLIVTTVGYRCVHQTRRPLAQRPSHLRTVAICARPTFGRRVGHNICIIRRRRLRSWRMHVIQEGVCVGSYQGRTRHRRIGRMAICHHGRRSPKNGGGSGRLAGGRRLGHLDRNLPRPTLLAMSASQYTVEGVRSGHRRAKCRRMSLKNQR
jgi:hypothetical protein